jgi:outer membrane scaffolding protein for murein synthesis (MipA/OmpV family)
MTARLSAPFPSLPSDRGPHRLAAFHCPPGVLSGLFAALLVPAASAAEPTAPSTSRPEVEGAIGLLVQVAPEYSGASRMSTSLTPAGFIRWGRFTLTGAGGFTTRRQDDVERGLGAELVRREGLRVKLGLRLDNGRPEGDSTRLSGLGDVKRTVRARLSAQWEVAPHWRLGAGLSLDTLNQGGGYVVDASGSREWVLGPGSTLTAAAGVSAAGDRYLQTWHGVTVEQSLRSGLPVFRPAEGLLGATASLTYRTELGPHWAGFATVGVQRLLGDAARSPLTERPSNTRAAAGLVWRF